MFVVDGKYLGSENSLAFDGQKFQWKNIESDDLVFGDHKYSIFPLMKMFDFQAPVLIEEKYKKMASILGLSNPYYYGLIGANYRHRLKKIIPSVYEFYKKIESHRYLPVYKKTQDFLHCLKPAKVNPIKYNSLRMNNVSYPDLTPQNGEFPVIRYDRAGTKTGRLVVKSGPNVLTMKSEHRNITKGKSIDFSSMEPRLLLALIGKTVDGDLYDWAAKELKIDGDRTYIKVSIISSMYGSRVVPEISKLFALDEWVSQLESDVSDGWIENYFGRPLYVKDVYGRKLLALWLQSTAVDAALLGFPNLVKENKDIIPHWVIHDGLIISGSSNVPKMLKITDDIKLPITVSEL